MSAPEAPAFKLDLDLKVGKYDVQKMLGKGATGTVYLAKDTFTGKEVALKTIEPEVFRDPEFGTVYRSQFLNEASLAGKLRHPYIVNILDAVVGEDSGHIAMELVTGGDLSKHVTSGKLLPVADVIQVGFKCCGALGAQRVRREGIRRHNGMQADHRRESALKIVGIVLRAWLRRLRHLPFDQRRHRCAPGELGVSYAGSCGRKDGAHMLV